MTSSGITSLVRYWVAWRPIPGESACGDQYLVQEFPRGVLVAAVDGLGHGDEARDAAFLAVTTLAAHAHEPVSVLVQRCHEELRRSRGAVMTLASFSEETSTMTWLAIGNVEAMLIRTASAPGGRPVTILPRGGIVGDRLPPLNPATLPVHCGDLLLLATDGIGSTFVRDIGRMEQPRQLVNHIFEQHAKSTDDALILGVQWTSGSTTAEAMP